MRKLPRLNTLVIDCAEGDSGVEDCLCALYGIAPRLQCLTLR